MKEFIPWNKENELGIKEIDDQHKKLLQLVNEAHNLKEKSGSKEELKRLLSEVVEYVRYHFGTEEKYFKEFNYEGAEEHIKQHNKITEETLEFYNKFDKGEDIIDEFFEFLSSWFDDHCNKYDRGYLKCFKDHGLK